ncbi:hypothetical protein [Sinorhizobium meliloti]|uniref:hypothetical protein n=1 Tax=Rhizobium meliloti TaxID=382 RepID=UPI0013E330AA|nr:hypothetical protein [Sinorhizobium meliloti]
MHLVDVSSRYRILRKNNPSGNEHDHAPERADRPRLEGLHRALADLLGVINSRIEAAK